MLTAILVYSDGNVCISILHPPVDDPMGYEKKSERWSAVQSVEKILLSVVSMLAGISYALHAFPLDNDDDGQSPMMKARQTSTRP